VAQVFLICQYDQRLRQVLVILVVLLILLFLVILGLLVDLVIQLAPLALYLPSRLIHQYFLAFLVAQVVPKKK
jgi:hypothetical protein